MASPAGGPPNIGAPQPLDSIDYVSSDYAQDTAFVVFDGTNYQVGWTGVDWLSNPSSVDSGPPHVARVSPAGALLDPLGTILDTASVPFAQVMVGAQRAFVGTRSSSTSGGASALVLDLVGPNGQVNEVTLATDVQACGLASSGSNLVVTYREKNSSTLQALVTDATGAILGSNAIAGGGTVAANALGFISVASTETGITATRYGWDLTALDASPIVLSSDVPLTTFAVGGSTDTLIAWGVVTKLGEGPRKRSRAWFPAARVQRVQVPSR